MRPRSSWRLQAVRGSELRAFVLRCSRTPALVFSSGSGWPRAGQFTSGSCFSPRGGAAEGSAGRNTGRALCSVLFPSALTRKSCKGAAATATCVAPRGFYSSLFRSATVALYAPTRRRQRKKQRSFAYVLYPRRMLGTRSHDLMPWRRLTA